MVQSNTNREIFKHTKVTEGAAEKSGTDAEGFSAAEICEHIKVAYESFIGGKTNRKAFEAVTRHLYLALAARRSAILEREQLTAQRCERFYIK